jgi:3-hydroxyacyl-CoA dehydrogenase, NAD binding domain
LIELSVASGISSSTACPPKTYSTSNASIIPISTLASTLSVERADRFLGRYFVSPVWRMARVEVIRQIIRQRTKMVTQRSAWKSKGARRDTRWGSGPRFLAATEIAVLRACWSSIPLTAERTVYV